MRGLEGRVEIGQNIEGEGGFTQQSISCRRCSKLNFEN